MDLKLGEYVAYLALSVALTIWVAATLSRNGRRFLIDVFKGDEGLADSVNHLLVVGFYLVNLGYVSLQLTLDTSPQGVPGLVEALAGKIGLVLVVLGILHFGNLAVFARLRQASRRVHQQAPAPQPWAYPGPQAPPPAPMR